MKSILSAFALISIAPEALAHFRPLYVGANLSTFIDVSIGFGINITKYPFSMRQKSDAGGDAPFFTRKVEWVENPAFPCGMNEELGEIDSNSFLSLAEGKGLPTTASDGSLEVLLFQVNRDGGGPIRAAVNTDGTMKSWTDIPVLKQCPGVEGMWPVDRVNHTVAVKIPLSTNCTGGVTKHACIVRIRGGWLQRFGGCFAVKMANAQPPATYSVLPLSTSLSTLSSDQITIVSKAIIQTMKSKGLIVTKGNKPHKRSLDLEDSTSHLHRRSMIATKTFNRTQSSIITAVLKNLQSMEMVLT